MDYDIPEYLRRPSEYEKYRATQRKERRIRILVNAAVILIALAGLVAAVIPSVVVYERNQLPDPCELAVVTCGTQVEAYITGYNTVPEQTDDTPCIAASGANICGRDDVVACPRSIPLGTEVLIGGKTYVCEDRLAPKYDHRYDISCDKDMACPYEVTGYKLVTIKD